MPSTARAGRCRRGEQRIRALSDRLAAERAGWIERNRYFHEQDRRYMRFLVPAGSRVLELGCGIGDLLAALEPSAGLGIDFSPAMIAMARQRHPTLSFASATSNCPRPSSASRARSTTSSCPT